jgi:hypothetical protein
MANDKDGLYGIVTGTVGKVGPYAKGQRISVEYQGHPNNKYPDRVVVWDDKQETRVSEGDRVKVSGFLSARKNERDGKVYVDVAINSPRIELLTAVESSATVGDSWNTPGTYDGGTPF